MRSQKAHDDRKMKLLTYMAKRHLELHGVDSLDELEELTPLTAIPRTELEPVVKVKGPKWGHFLRCCNVGAAIESTAVPYAKGKDSTEVTGYRLSASGIRILKLKGVQL